MPNQYARVKNVEKGENVVKDNTDQNYAQNYASKDQVFMKQM
jgi:hypothetical protein